MWGIAISCAVYLLNRFPSKRIGNITLEEAWSLWKLRVDHLRIFGSIAYDKVPDEKKTKLGDIGQKCILFGYGETSNGYKLYNPTTKKIAMSTDIDFNEYQIWSWGNGKEQKKTIIKEEEEEKNGSCKANGEIPSSLTGNPNINC